MNKFLTNRWLSLVVTTIPVMIMGLILALPAYAQGPVVDTAVDENDGSCADGDCSLRDAIATANSGETITFAGDLTIYLDSELQISDTLTIDGESHIITLSGDSGNDGSRNVRAFYIQNSGVVTLTKLNIISGYDYSDGGAIYNDGGMATINNSNISGNRLGEDNSTSGRDGGAIYNASAATMTINSSVLSGNRAGSDFAPLAYGGAISNWAMLTINDSILSDNHGNAAGGAIYNHDTGTAMINNSTLSSNHTNSGCNCGGGAIVNSGVFTINNSTLSGNNTSNHGGQGGGIFNDGGGSILTISDSTISGNQTVYDGGGIYTEGTVTINNSTISNNQTSYSGGSGGGIKVTSGTATINNSTISNNQSYLGGGIYIIGTVIINNSTIFGNQADEYSGGIVIGVGPLHMRNTIIANNFTTLSDPDNCINFGTIATNAYNLIEGGDCNVVDGGSPIGFLTGDPLLGPLADNGGPTWTHAVLTGSPVINQGDPAFDPNAFTPPMTTDQRGSGFNRIINSRIDIGAFEFDPTSPGVASEVFLPLIIKN